jgi:hypothetical protein
MRAVLHWWLRTRRLPGDEVSMKTFLALLVVMVVAAACTPAETAEINKIDPPLPLNANTTHVCWDGTVCQNWEQCPPPGYPKAGCEAVVDVGPADHGDQLGRRRRRDAGRADASDDDDAGDARVPTR